LMPLSDGAQNYSVSDWVSVSDTNDVGTDVLLSWKLDDGVERYAVITDMANDWGDAYGTSGNKLPIVGSYLQGAGVSQYGTQGDDYLKIDGRTTLYGRGGDDRLIAYSEDRYDESNKVFAGSNAILHGGSGVDRLEGGAGDDKLFGGPGRDTLVGSYGNDFLEGGAGNDLLIGGVGDDIYIVDQGDVVVEDQGPVVFNAPVRHQVSTNITVAEYLAVDQTADNVVDNPDDPYDTYTQFFKRYDSSTSTAYYEKILYTVTFDKPVLFDNRAEYIQQTYLSFSATTDPAVYF